MKLVLIPCAPTPWRRAGRLLGRAEVSPAPDAAQVLGSWAQQLSQFELGPLLHGPDELSTFTARTLARALRATARLEPWLIEANLGLWTGLTCEQLAHRFPSVCAQLQEAPLNIVAPDGESLDAVAQRLRKGFERLAVRRARGAAGVVLRPLALALTKCLFAPAEADGVWEQVEQPDAPQAIEFDPTKPSEPPRRAADASAGAER